LAAPFQQFATVNASSGQTQRGNRDDLTDQLEFSGFNSRPQKDNPPPMVWHNALYLLVLRALHAHLPVSAPPHGESACAIRPISAKECREPAGKPTRTAPDWRQVFWQDRIFPRARRLTFARLVCLRLHLTSRAICATRTPVCRLECLLPSLLPVLESAQLFDPIFDRYQPRCLAVGAG